MALSCQVQQKKRNRWKKEMVSWISLKFKTSALQKTLLKKLKDKPKTQRQYLQNTQLIKDLYPKYTQNFYNSTVRKQTFQLQMGRRSEKTAHQRRYTDGK